MKTKPRYFFRDLLVLAAAALLIVAYVTISFEKDWREVSERYIRGTTLRAGEEFGALVENIEKSLGMVRDWGAAGKISPAAVEESKGMLLPFFGKHAVLSGISVAGTDDAGFFLLPDGTVRRPGKEKLYNPSDRPWFGPALETDGCAWTGIYRFFTLGEPGITASIAWKNSKGSQTVAAFDVRLEDFFQSVQRLAPTPASRAFIFQPDGQLYIPGTELTKPELQLVIEENNELMMMAMSLWKDSSIWDDEGIWDDGSLPELKVAKTVLKGKAWWCGFVPLEKSSRNVWMGVMVPEDDIVGDMAKRRRMYIGIGAVVFLAVTGLYLWVRRRGRRAPVFSEAVDAEFVRQRISGGESRSVEFKSTMRMNLHAGKPGKEIELAWLKGVAGFLNTDGGTLLLGVTDDGEICGLEKDLFENNDKCRLHFKNLIAAHLGADLSKYIRFSLVHIDGKSVGVVRCARSAEPVFLKDGNKEHFYIRNGPSSDELPVSKALNYIKHRR